MRGESQGSPCLLNPRQPCRPEPGLAWNFSPPDLARRVCEVPAPVFRLPRDLDPVEDCLRSPAAPARAGPLAVLPARPDFLLLDGLAALNTHSEHGVGEHCLHYAGKSSSCRSLCSVCTCVVGRTTLGILASAVPKQRCSSARCRPAGGAPGLHSPARIAPPSGGSTRTQLYTALPEVSVCWGHPAVARHRKQTSLRAAARTLGHGSPGRTRRL